MVRCVNDLVRIITRREKAGEGGCDERVEDIWMGGWRGGSAITDTTISSAWAAYGNRVGRCRGRGCVPIVSWWTTYERW